MPASTCEYGVTSGLTWDFTVNTDFAQVEANVEQINLTRFSLFFPEKRDFFLENAGIFEFGVGHRAARGGGGGGGRQNAVAGHDPVLQPSDWTCSPDGERDSDSRRDTTYRPRRRLLDGRAQHSAAAERGTPTPSANFTALRLRRDVFAQLRTSA